MTTRTISAIYVICSLAAGIVVIGQHGRLAAALGVPDVVATALLVASTLPPLLYPFLLRFHRILGPAAGLAMVLVVAIMQPRIVAATMRDKTSGSDQGECIIVGLEGLSSGEWPYDATQMSKGNPMSCGPLWLIAHLPSTLAGYSTALFIIMAGAVATIGFLCGWATVSKLLVLLALTPVTWLSLIVGSDFLTFGLCTAALAAAGASKHAVLRRVAIPASILLAHFRLPFVGLPAAFFLRRDSDGRLSGVWLAAVTTTVSVVLWVLFYRLDPERFVSMGPMHVIGKFEYMTGVSVNWIAAFVALIVISVVLALLCSRFDTVGGTVVFCAAILIPMALANVYQMARQSYPHWEGAFWIAPLIVLTALVLAGRSPRRNNVSLSTAHESHKPDRAD